MSGARQPAVDLGGGFVLRPWATGDAAEFVLSQRDPLVRRYASRLIDDPREADEAIAGWSRRWSDGRGAAWALRSDRSGRDLLGAVQYGVLHEDLGHGSVGYWLLPHARGRGLASAAVIASCAVIFERLGWQRIELYHAVENDRSCRVARRAGFPQEGVLRSAMRYPDDGRWSDEHLHARLRTDPAVSR